MCVSGFVSKKIRVDRSLLNFYFFSKILFIIFPDLNKKHNRCIVYPKYIMKRGLFRTVTEEQRKNMTVKVAKPITKGHK